MRGRSQEGPVRERNEDFNGQPELETRAELECHWADGLTLRSAAKSAIRVQRRRSVPFP